jgi:hypothetical protein
MKLQIIFLSIVVIMLSLAGCSAKSPNIEVLINSIDTQIGVAQNAGADQLASAEYNDAKSLLDSAKASVKSSQKTILAQKAYVKACLAEAIVKQVTAENEANRLEAELKVIEEDAIKIKGELQVAEDELKQAMTEKNDELNNK